MSQESISSPTRVDAMENYLFHNLAYAQSSLGFDFGTLAFVFKSRGSARDLFTLYSMTEWEEIFKIMNNAHASHNITKDISIEELIDSQTSNKGALLIKSIRAINQFLPETQQVFLPSEKISLEEYQQLFQTWDSISENPVNDAMFETLGSYSTTILAALKSKEALELSKMYRKNLDPKKKASLSLMEVMDESFFESSIKKILKKALLENHEELKEDDPNYEPKDSSHLETKLDNIMSLFSGYHLSEVPIEYWPKISKEPIPFLD